MRPKKKNPQGQGSKNTFGTLNRFANLLLEDEVQAEEKARRAKGPTSAPAEDTLAVSATSNDDGKTLKVAASKSFTKPKPSYIHQPIVWIDCEMTGLLYDKDKIIEIAVIVTDGQLEPVDEGLSLVIHQPKEIMSRMGPWCKETHGRTGLTKMVAQSKVSTAEAEAQVLEYIQRYVPERAGLLAGSSVHADRAFLLREMPKITDWLHYRIIDVSSIKELKNRWFPDVIVPRSIRTQNGTLHRALDDIRASIDELKGYRETIFIQAEPRRKESQTSTNKIDYANAVKSAEPGEGSTDQQCTVA